MRRNFSAILFALLTFVSVSVGQVVRITPAERKLADAITADQLKHYLYFVASDAMEGRDTPSRGLDVTAEFLKMNLSRWGFKPAGDNGTFFQKIELTSETVDPVNNVLQIGGRAFNLNTDFFRIGGNGSANALMVYAGNGWIVRAKNIDPYKSVDVRGKVVVLSGDGFPHPSTLTRPPAGVAESDLQGTRGVDWSDPATHAIANGAAGILLIASPQAQAGWGQIQRFYHRGNLYPTKLRDQPRQLPIMLVSSRVADAILASTPS